MPISNVIAAFLLVVAALYGMPLYAASQGTIGLTSQGSAQISVTKATQARISDISDMTLNNWSIGDGNVVLFSNVCIYTSTGNYRVTATGSGIGGLFTIASNSHLLPYSVLWNAGGPGSLDNTGIELLPTIQSTGFTTGNSASATCGGSSGNNARVIVGITETAMNLAASSSTPYTGTLTLLVSPY